MDIMLHSSLHAGISYAFAAKRTSYRVNYDMNINLIGMMFVPEYGESYYEISEGIMRGTVHFASLHNCIRFRQLLSFDMQFKRSAWRIGVEYFYGRQSANQLHFQTEQISLVVGTIFFTEAKIRRFR